MSRTKLLDRKFSEALVHLKTMRLVTLIALLLAAMVLYVSYRQDLKIQDQTRIIRELEATCPTNQ